MPLNVCFGWKLVLCNSALESVSLKYILMSNLHVLLRSRPLNVVVSKKLISVGSRVGLSFIEGWWLFRVWTNPSKSLAEWVQIPQISSRYLR